MPKYDEIGYWSEIKLDIVKAYATAYSTILSAQKNFSFYHIYIDAFAGAGKHVSKSTGKFVQGSPVNALLVNPPFKEYHFIDLNEQKIKELEELAGERKDVHIHHGDCNQVLIESVLPRVRYEDYRRALCLLDPYGLHLEWKVISAIGRLKTFDLFLNFPVADMNRNVLWRKPEGVSQEQKTEWINFGETTPGRISHIENPNK
jgi:three-Cys-motif partner protein